MPNYIDEVIKEFEEKFHYKFNIGVVPDSMTREEIKTFIRQALENLEIKIRKEYERKMEKN